MLTQEQIGQYHEKGYVIPNFRMPGEVLEAIKEDHDRFIKRHPDFVDYCPSLLIYDTSFLNYARNSGIIEMVSQVIGEDIALWNSSFFAKPALTGSKTPWHQDGEYWPIRPLATCTIWIAVDDSTTENGCLKVIPGSHKDRKLYKHERNINPGLALPLELQKSEYDESQAVDLVLEAGQISLHDVYLVHGSEANSSEKPRRGMTLRFMPTTSVYDRETEAAGVKNSNRRPRPIFLLRGTDQSGENDFTLW